MSSHFENYSPPTKTVSFAATAEVYLELINEAKTQGTTLSRTILSLVLEALSERRKVDLSSLLPKQ